MKVKSKLKQLEVRPSKERGQNFVVSDEVISGILEFGAPQPNENLIEIGPGLGALTEGLFAVAPLKVIEIESKFCVELKSKFPSIEVINADARQVDLSTLGDSLTIFGNLPYVFSTEILFRLVDYRQNIKRAVLLLQKEFANRVGACPGGRDYGVLSVSCQMVADIRFGPIFPGTSFHPPTKVDSRLIEVTFLEEPRFGVSDLAWLNRVVRAAFTQRRRQIFNSLKGSGMFSVDQVKQVLAALAIDPARRAETLSLNEFVQMAEAFKS